METRITTAGFSAHNGRVLGSIWVDGISVTLNLHEADARSIARELLSAADALPRKAVAADFGMAA